MVVEETRWKDGYIGMRELSRRLSLGERTIRSRMRDPDDALPAYLVGARLLFRWPDVVAWVERRRVVSLPVDRVVEEIVAQIGKDCDG